MKQLVNCGNFKRIRSQARKGRFNDYSERKYGQAAGSASRPEGRRDSLICMATCSCRKAGAGQRTALNKVYLVGTVDRWNDAKRAEEHDRVKHLSGHGHSCSCDTCAQAAAE